MMNDEHIKTWLTAKWFSIAFCLHSFTVCACWGEIQSDTYSYQNIVLESQITLLDISNYIAAITADATDVQQ